MGCLGILLNDESSEPLISGLLVMGEGVISSPSGTRDLSVEEFDEV